jgi:type 1 glutamine amidotransferase
MTRGYHHGSTSNGVAMFWNLGKESGEYDTEIKTDMEWGLTDEQKEALLSYVRDDGKGLIVAHASLDANYKWPDYAEMVGGWFNAHAWGTFNAPVIVEDQTFPAMRHFPKYLRLFDEMYSAKQWSRDKVNVLMRLDESKLNYMNPQYGVERTRPDKDEAIGRTEGSVTPHPKVN